MDPKNIKIATKYITSLFDVLNNTLALEICEKTLEIAPNNIDIQDHYGWSLILLSRYE